MNPTGRASFWSHKAYSTDSTRGQARLRARRGLRKLLSMHSEPSTAEDVVALQRHLGGDDRLHYVDLRQQSAVREALARWPWLRGVHHRCSGLAGDPAADLTASR
jgi:hypothetical protein